MAIKENLLDRISAGESSLSRAERKVAQAVLARPADVVGENIATLAKKADVSEPTVYRFCKSFGFDGFPSFKTALSICLSHEAVRTVQKVSTGDSVTDVASFVLDGTISILTALSRNLDLAVIARAIDLLSAARRTLVAAPGLNMTAALDLKLRLMRLGLSCEIYDSEEQMAVAAASMHNGDLLIAIDAIGSSRGALNAVAAAQKSQASVITLAPEGSDLALSAPLNLKTAASDDFFNDDLLLSLASLQALLQIVVAGVMLRRRDSIAEVREKIAQELRRLYQKDEGSRVAADITDRQPEALDPTKPIASVRFDF